MFNDLILFLKFIEFNVATRKTEKTAAVPQLPPNFFLLFLAELGNSEWYETNIFFFWKKFP